MCLVPGAAVAAAWTSCGIWTSCRCMVPRVFLRVAATAASRGAPLCCRCTPYTSLHWRAGMRTLVRMHMRRYIAWVKQTIEPRLTPESERILVDFFRHHSMPSLLLNYTTISR